MCVCALLVLFAILLGQLRVQVGLDVIEGVAAGVVDLTLLPQSLMLRGADNNATVVAATLAALLTSLLALMAARVRDGLVPSLLVRLLTLHLGGDQLWAQATSLLKFWIKVSKTNINLKQRVNIFFLYGLVVESGQDLAGEQAPPDIQVIALVAGHISGDGVVVQAVAVVPWLLGANEMNDLDAISESEMNFFFFV